MAVPAHRLAFARLLHRDLDLTAFFDAADRLLAKSVPFDASCWLGLDPETLLPTSHFSRDYSVADLLLLVSNEFLEDDFNKFRELARGEMAVAILSEATDGELGRSRRHVDFLVERGFGDGDELRGVLREPDGTTWGAIAIHRRRGRFDANDRAIVASLTGMLANGIRRAIVRSSLSGEAGREPVGLVLLRSDDTIETATPSARRWLEELFDSTSASTAASNRPPLTVASVAGVARRAARGTSDEVASSRIPRRSGGWLRLDASPLEDARVAVMISSGSDAGVAEMIARAHGLSVREREVVSLTLRGLSTREMAAELGVTPYTVQDHLKSVFDKVGVRSRRELAAQLFVADVVPRMAVPDGEALATG
jgi:DNA-binding CsgD family transcriptional regulator